MDRAELAVGDHLARLLHQRIAAIVERDRVHDAGGGRGLEQPPRLGARSSPAACPRSRACAARAPPESPGRADNSASCCGRRARRDRRRAPRSCRTPSARRARRPSAAPRLRCSRRWRRRPRSRAGGRRRCDGRRRSRGRRGPCRCRRVSAHASACFAYSKHFFTSSTGRALAAILVLDVRGDRPPFLLQQLQHLANRRVALAPRHVVALVLLAILQVQVRDVGVMLADVGHAHRSWRP